MDQPILTEQDIRALLRNKTETRNLDYKKDINWRTATKDQKLGIVKDILAMSNTRDGGQIILGVKDKTFELVGLKKKSYDSFDQTELNNYLQKYTEPKFTCQVSKHIIDGQYVVAIDVPECAEVPIICKDNAYSLADKTRQILRSGQIYIRTEKATSEAISSAQEMREFLGHALVKKGDELLQNIERLIKGRPAKTTDESKERYDSEIAEANEFIDRVIGKELSNYGYWELVAYPVQYQERRISELPRIKEVIEKSRVSLRGWSTPHVDNKDTGNFGKGTESSIIWGVHVEGYRMYQSGLFAFRRAFWEDKGSRNSDRAEKVLDFIGIIWTLTEFILFVKRLHGELLGSEDIYVKIGLHDCDQRQLVCSDRSVSFWGPYICKESHVILDGMFKGVELKASHREIAAKWAKHIFHVFNWERVSAGVIDGWQTKLIERKY